MTPVRPTRPARRRPSSPSGRALDLHVDALVLRGFTASPRRIADALERELGLLLAGERLPAALLRERRLESLDAGAVVLPSDATPGQIGRQVARALYAGLRR